MESTGKGIKCTAKNKRNGQPCGNYAVAGKTKCRMHGGKTPAGVASPHFRTGKYSKHLPSRLIATYQESLEDPKLWELGEKAALLDTRLVELVKRLDTGESGATWAALRATWADMKDAIKRVDAVAMLQLLPVVDNLIDAGNRDRAAWDEIVSLVHTFKSLSESERKHIDQLNQVMTAEQVLVMISAITDIIRQNVIDKTILSAISNGITRLISVDPGR